MKSPAILLSRILGAAAILAAPTLLPAAVLVVDSTADDGSPGTLRAAITTANSNFQNDTITFSLSLPATITLTSALPAIGSDDGNGLVIDGPGTVSDLIIEADAAPFTATYRVFEVALGANLELRDVTVRHGFLAGAFDAGQTMLGGGIRNNGGRLTLLRVDVNNNAAIGSSGNLAFGGHGRGGGVHSTGTLSITDSTIRSNVAAGGSGVSGGHGEGGGLYADLGDAVITGTTIRGNQASGGPAVSSQGGTGTGGGIRVPAEGGNATASLLNCTVSGNTASGGAGGGASATTEGFAIGGGLRCDNEAGLSLLVQFCTISDNNVNSLRTNGAQGGGISSGGNTDDQGARLRATIVANNLENLTDPDDIFGNILSSGFNLIETTAGGIVDVAGTGVDGFANDGTGNILGADPNLGALADNGGETQTRALLSISPAFDAGTTLDVYGSTVSVDQRGIARPQFGEGDIGAFESTTVVPVEISEIEIE